MTNDKRGNAPDGFEQHKPSGKQSRGPSMKERLLAQRRAELAEQEAQAAKPKAQPAPPAKPRKAAAKRAPIQGTPTRRASAKPRAPKAAEEVVADVVDEVEEAAEQKSSRSNRSRSSSRSGSSRARSSSSRSSRSSRKGKGDDGDDGEEGGDSSRSGRSRRPAKAEKSKLVPVLGTIGVLAIAGVGVWKFMGGSGDADAAEKPGLPQETGMSAANSTNDKQAEDQAVKDAAAKAKADADKEAAAAKEPKAKKDPAALEDGKIPRNRHGRQKVAAVYADDLYDPQDSEEPDLASFERFEKPEDCSDEQWTTIQAKIVDMLDPDAGAAGGRAATALEKIGKNAFPALVNALLGLDYSTLEGNETGDFVQRTCMNLSNGRNIGWYYGFDKEPNKTEIINRRTVEKYYEVWSKAKDSPTYWEGYVNTEKGKRAKSEGDKPAADDAADAADDAADDDLMDDLGIDD